LYNPLKNANLAVLMSNQFTNIKQEKKGASPRKKVRMVGGAMSRARSKSYSPYAAPVPHDIHFAIVSADVQMSTRNNAYQFFSLH